MNSNSYESEAEEGEKEYAGGGGDSEDVSYASSPSSSDEDDSDDEKDEFSSPKNQYDVIFSDFKQHIIAIGVAVLAAIMTHVHIHGGYTTWRDEMRKDWDRVIGILHMNREEKQRRRSEFLDDSDAARRIPYAAPSMNLIPARHHNQRNLVALLEKLRINGGHSRARAYRRTVGLSFCPTAHSSSVVAPAIKEDGTSSSSSSSSDTNNLKDVDFFLALDPGVRVLHSYYLADALGIESSMVYDDPTVASILGSYGSDVILKDIDDALNQDELQQPTSLDDIQRILESHLPVSLVDNEHVCLLHQYALNKGTGMSIRGTTKGYIRPHVSTFYRSKLPSHSVRNTAVVANDDSNTPKSEVTAAPLSHNGFATKFINLSLHPVNLYWDGSGPKEGQMHTLLVGTVPSMESIGTTSHPGHQFFVTTTYDKDYVLHRQIVTADEPVWYYDPLDNLSLEKRLEEMERMTKAQIWTTKQRFGREAWMVNQSFLRDYVVKTRLMWLATFPQPYHDGTSAALDEVSNHMWPAEFIGQVHSFVTSHLYFIDLPQNLEILTKKDYQPYVESQRRVMMEKFQSSSVKGVDSISSNNKDNSDKSMSLNIKVVSCTPRVFEVKKFLSPVEVQHLINLASGMMGDWMAQSPTASATGRVRGDTKTEAARSSSKKGGWIHREHDVVVDTIFRRVADLLHIDERLMRDHDLPDGLDGDEVPFSHHRIVEAMQLMRYDPGEGYAAHHDFAFPSIESRHQPRRFASILLYLTGEGDVVENGVRSPSSENSDNALEGGETTFPRAITTQFHDGVKIKPQSGKAVMFYNVLPDGNYDDLSQHAGEKVKSGVKYLANIFVWDPIIN